jgi:hypothetical protein
VTEEGGRERRREGEKKGGREVNMRIRGTGKRKEHYRRHRTCTCLYHLQQVRHAGWIKMPCA